MTATVLPTATTEGLVLHLDKVRMKTIDQDLVDVSTYGDAAPRAVPGGMYTVTFWHEGNNLTVKLNADDYSALTKTAGFSHEYEIFIAKKGSIT